MSISIIYLKSGDRKVKGDICLPIKTWIKLKALLSSHLMIHIVFILLISDSTVVHIIISILWFIGYLPFCLLNGNLVIIVV